MTSKKQSVPVVIEKYYRHGAGRRKGELGWLEGKAGKDQPYARGKRAEHTTRLTIQAPTSLPGLLTAIARTLRQPAETTSFQFYTRGHGVCVYAFAAGSVREGRPAVAIASDILSPMEWHEDPDGLWTCLPDHMTSWREYYGLADLLTQFPAGAPMEGWVWKRRITTDHERKSMIALDMATKIMQASELTAADAKAIRAIAEDMIKAGRAA